VGGLSYNPVVVTHATFGRPTKNCMWAPSLTADVYAAKPVNAFSSFYLRSDFYNCGRSASGGKIRNSSGTNYKPDHISCPNVFGFQSCAFQFMNNVKIKC
jgi:hypothetical protein